MSVNLESYRQISAAKKSVSEALTAVSEVVVHECSGAENYNADYRNKLIDAMNGLIKVRRLLNNEA